MKKALSVPKSYNRWNSASVSNIWIFHEKKTFSVYPISIAIICVFCVVYVAIYIHFLYIYVYYGYLYNLVTAHFAVQKLILKR